MKGKKYVSVVVAAGLVTAVAAAPAVAGTAGPRDRADLQAMLDRIVDAGAVGAIAEVRDGSRTWRGTSGRARIGRAQTAPVDGRFRVGSVTTDPGMTKKAYGLGLEPAPLPCGTAWGHGGGAQGYLTVAFSSADGSRQVALSMNPVLGGSREGGPGPADLRAVPIGRGFTR
ncbi:hypothetical protein AB0392_06270 [Nonomuraea angiospora]|uniref:hypothetical protein n=1 Tax=Nonomuraea angiospora TaxID=46172 RepID=UPI00344D677C